MTFFLNYDFLIVVFCFSHGALIKHSCFVFLQRPSFQSESHLCRTKTLCIWSCQCWLLFEDELIAASLCKCFITHFITLLSDQTCLKLLNLLQHLLCPTFKLLVSLTSTTNPVLIFTGYLLPFVSQSYLLSVCMWERPPQKMRGLCVPAVVT